MYFVVGVNPLDKMTNKTNVVIDIKRSHDNYAKTYTVADMAYVSMSENKVEIQGYGIIENIESMSISVE